MVSFNLVCKKGVDKTLQIMCICSLWHIHVAQKYPSYSEMLLKIPTLSSKCGLSPLHPCWVQVHQEPIAHHCLP